MQTPVKQPGGRPPGISLAEGCFLRASMRCGCYSRASLRSCSTCVATLTIPRSALSCNWRPAASPRRDLRCVPSHASVVCGDDDLAAVVVLRRDPHHTLPGAYPQLMAAVRLRTRYAGVLLVPALLSPLLSCSDGTDRDMARPSARSSPFRVRRKPQGYRLFGAGKGIQKQEWGEDSSGTDEPFTVLAPAGETAQSRNESSSR